MGTDPESSRRPARSTPRSWRAADEKLQTPSSSTGARLTFDADGVPEQLRRDLRGLDALEPECARTCAGRLAHSVEMFGSAWTFSGMIIRKCSARLRRERARSARPPRSWSVARSSAA